MLEQPPATPQVAVLKKEVDLLTRKRKNALLDLLFFLPQFLLYFTFTILPFFVALPMVLTDQVNFLDQEIRFVGIDNFLSIFKSPIIDELLPACRRTFVFTLLNYGMVFLFGMPLALIFYEFTIRAKNAFFVVIYMPYMVSYLGIGMMLPMLLSRDSGSLNLILLSLGLIRQPLDVMVEGVAAVSLPLIMGWRNAGFNMALFLAGLLAIPVDTVDASRVDGVSYAQRLRYVYLPQMIPSITIATIMCMLHSFGAFDLPIGFGGLRGNQSAYFLSLLIYKMGFTSGDSQAGTLAQAVTISIIVYLPMVLLAYFLNRLQKRLRYE